MDREETMHNGSEDDGEPYISLREAARLGGYTNSATLRQAINRETMRGEVRRHELGFTYYVTKRSWLIEYLAQRPRFRDERLQRVLSDGSVEEE